MAQPILAARMPVACAACYQQKPDAPHVDFRAATEGAQVQGGPRAPHVDWVVICDACIRNAHNLLPDVSGPREVLERRVADLEEQLSATQAYADRVEDALSHRPAEREPKAAPAPKPSPRQRKPRYEQGAA